MNTSAGNTGTGRLEERGAEPTRSAAWPIPWPPPTTSNRWSASPPGRFVCLGEASHGTREYYHWRALPSRRLIEEYGFTKGT